MRYCADTLRLYDLHAYVLLGNHVHVLFHPLADVAGTLRRLKSFTARRDNALLGKEGLPFWQSESFDHWIRSDLEFAETMEYIHENPVKAGLVRRAEAYPWSSAYNPRR